MCHLTQVQSNFERGKGRGIGRQHLPSISYPDVAKYFLTVFGDFYIQHLCTICPTQIEGFNQIHEDERPFTYKF